MRPCKSVERWLEMSAFNLRGPSDLQSRGHLISFFILFRLISWIFIFFRIYFTTFSVQFASMCLFVLPSKALFDLPQLHVHLRRFLGPPSE